MLRLTVKLGASVFVGEDPTTPFGMISILGVRKSEVQIGIVAPRERMRIYRQEVVERVAGGREALEAIVARLKEECARSPWVPTTGTAAACSNLRATAGPASRHCTPLAAEHNDSC